ncbi:cytochrome P450 family protein [Cavenderia fasciculata]|uniref:Cytochrome P450 family protein n=1 Tax=Cavenderia fasciculata TaxID=261658 RepID=F4Q1M3_CACFS|nr:cytochrome P450 family protein [Cavenderia fasciculata]EGG18724.1 cytochrome P450 family protein [Cavenderia fasciculata]|eukprot:XP_004366628.1 cytochrome P450 family protein [Cavenderia fasciculata]
MLTFISIFRVPYINQLIFTNIKHISKQIYSTLTKHDGTLNVSQKGSDIITSQQPLLAMISQYALPWHFIKHYINNNKEELLFERRMYSITKYCSHPNATLDTLIHLLEWSPDYDPQKDYYASYYTNLVASIASVGHVAILEHLIKRYPNLDYYNAYDMAAENGHLPILKLLTEQTSAQSNDISGALDQAARRGYLDVVTYIHQTRPASSKSEFSNALDSAGSNGHLDMLKFLLSNRVVFKCTENTANGAANNGHLHILKYLHENKIENVFSKRCMDFASMRGHFEVVQWLHKNRTEGCTVAALNRATTLELIRFLHLNRTEGATTLAIDSAAFYGLDMVKYLAENRSEGCTPTAYESAALGNVELEVFQYLHEKFNLECTKQTLRTLAKNGRVDVIHYFNKQFPTSNIWKPKIMDTAAEYGQIDVVKYLHENRSEGCTRRAMDEACGDEGSLEMVKWLHFNRTEGCSANAMDTAARYGKIDIVKFLHYNRTEGCSIDSMGAAAQYGHLEVMEFIQENCEDAYMASTVFYDNRSPFRNYNKIVQFVLDRKLVEKEFIDKRHTVYLATNAHYEILQLISSVWEKQQHQQQVYRPVTIPMLFTQVNKSVTQSHLKGRFGQYTNDSTNMVSFWLISLVIIILSFVIRNKKYNEKDPPGPFSYPVIGIGPFKLGCIHLVFRYYLDRYAKVGKVLKIFLFDQPYITIANPTVLKNVYSAENGQYFKTRPPPIRHILAHNTNNSFIMADYPQWKETRKLLIGSFGKSKLAKNYSPFIDSQTQELLKKFKHYNGQPIEINDYWKKYFMNMVSNHAFSHYVSYDEDFNQGFYHKIYHALEGINFGMLVQLIFSSSYFMWPLNYLIQFILKDHYTALLTELTNIYNQHVKTIDDENPRDLCDLLISAGNEKEYVINTCFDMYTGLETSLFTCQWAVLMLNNYPLVQEKVFQELDEIVGRGNQCFISHRPNTPYFNAFLLEVFRYRPTVIYSFPRECTQDVILSDYFFPKNCMVAASVDVLHHDPDYFDDPHTFNPDRFMNPPIGQLNNKENILLFGSGNKICIGMNLVNDAIYIALTNLLLNFKIKNETETSIIFSSPNNYSYCLSQR